MDTNLFLNSYKKKEDELTYAFLSMTEILNSKEFYEFLSQKSLINNSLKSIRLLPVGNGTNPDGELILIDANNDEFKLLFENKTKIRKLDKNQLEGHLTLCKTYDKLLVITPRKSDKSIIDEIKNNKIVFFTWSEIASKLNKDFSENIIAKQFVEYGKISGQFEELGEILHSDILNEIEKFKVNFDNKMDNILRFLKEKFETDKYLFSKENIKYDDSGDYGRWGIEIFGKRKRKTYAQWIFVGYYYNTEDHGIEFRKIGIPEIAIFFDVYYEQEIDPEKLNKILDDKEFCNKIKSLTKYGFEHNLDKKITENANRLFFRRKSLDEFDILNAFVLNDFVEETFDKIALVGLNEHKYFKELL
jgi:hypothetical protein